MKCTGNEPKVTDGPTLSREAVRMVPLLARRSIPAGAALDCRPATLVNTARGTAKCVRQWQPPPRRRRQQPASLRVAHLNVLDANPLASLLAGHALHVGRGGLGEDGTRTFTLLPPNSKSGRSRWQWFHRLVGLSGLGWAFVVMAVAWELFALAFSQRAGWGWDNGALFFVWGLGILAFGFYLRASRERPAVSRLFFGVNILLVSVLSLVFAGR